MVDDRKPTTSKMNGRLWGTRAQDWADFQEGTARAVYEAVLERTRVESGTRYVDIGCGAGMAAQIAASRGAEVSGIDAADALLAIARSRVPGADFQQGDLEALPFADQWFDVVTGFNSFQYAGNPVVALTEARRMTKPDGSVIIMTWGNPEGMEAASLVAALRPLMPTPPPGAPGPFALSDEAALRQFAAGAGLDPVEVFDVDSPLFMPMKRRRCAVSTRRAWRPARWRTRANRPSRKPTPRQSLRFVNPTAAIASRPRSVACWRGPDGLGTTPEPPHYIWAPRTSGHHTAERGWIRSQRVQEKNHSLEPLLYVVPSCGRRCPTRLT